MWIDVKLTGNKEHDDWAYECGLDFIRKTYKVAPRVRVKYFNGPCAVEVYYTKTKIVAKALTGLNELR